jgi:hypothetical protein
VAASKKLKDAPYYVLDTGSIADIKPFVEKIVKEHPEVRQACRGWWLGRCADTSHSSTASSTTQACSARSTSTTSTLMRRTRS